MPLNNHISGEQPLKTTSPAGQGLQRQSVSASGLYLQDNRRATVTQLHGPIVQRMTFPEYEEAARKIQTIPSEEPALHDRWQEARKVFALAHPDPKEKGLSNTDFPVVQYRHAVDLLIMKIETEVNKAGKQELFKGALRRLANSSIATLEEYFKHDSHSREDNVKLDVDRVNRAKAGAKGSHPVFLLQADYMSGDRFGVATALLLNTNLNVIIIYNATSDGVFKEMEAFYKKFEGSVPGRIKGIAVENPHAVYGESGITVTKGTEIVAEYQKTLKDQEKMKAKRGHGQASFKKTHNIPEGNDLSDEQLAVHNRLKNEVLFKDVDVAGYQRAAEAFLSGIGIVKGGAYAFIWTKYRSKSYDGNYFLNLERLDKKVVKMKTRFKMVQAFYIKQGRYDIPQFADAGKALELAKADTEKLYHFSSSDAWLTLIHTVATNTARIPVLIGDKAPKLLKGGIIDLTEFWNKIPQQAHGKVDRMDQWRFFSLLAEKYNAVNIGMRSGGLEAPMLAGMKTIYLEEAGNTNPERMEKWLDAFPNYLRILLDAPLGGESKRQNWMGDKRNKKDWKSKIFQRLMTKLKGKKRDFSASELTAIRMALDTAQPKEFTMLKASFGRFSTINLNHNAREAQLGISELPLVPVNVMQMLKADRDIFYSETIGLKADLETQALEIELLFEDAEKDQPGYSRLKLLAAMEPVLDKLRSDISKELAGPEQPDDESLHFDLFEMEAPVEAEVDPAKQKLLNVNKTIDNIRRHLQLIKEELLQIDNRNPYRVSQKPAVGLGAKPVYTYDIIEYLKKGEPVTTEFYSIIQSIIRESVPADSLRD